jgi:hypothetical protein
LSRRRINNASWLWGFSPLLPKPLFEEGQGEAKAPEQVVHHNHVPVRVDNLGNLREETKLVARNLIDEAIWHIFILGIFIFIFSIWHLAQTQLN